MNKYYDGKVRSFAYGAKEMRDEKDVNACAENERTAEREQLNEDIVLSWVHLSSILKNSRVTNGLAYNEAVVMLLLYNEYRAGGKGILPFSRIVEETRMLKSQANRTVASLEAKGFVTKQGGARDKRAVYVAASPDCMDKFLAVHNNSLALADGICNIIGEEDARVFVRIVEKIVARAGDENLLREQEN